MKLKPRAILAVMLISSCTLWAGLGYDYGSGAKLPNKLVGISLALNAVMFLVWDVRRLIVKPESLTHALIIRVDILFLLTVSSLSYIMIYYKNVFMSRVGYLVLQCINAGLLLFIILQIIWFLTKKKIRPST